MDAEREQRGIDTAFITDGKRLKPRRKELFSHWVMRRTGTRDITQCTFVTAAGNELIALANHWPSRSAPAGRGPQYSAGFRATAGETLGYWHERIREVKGPDAAVLAMGDFNDDPFDASLTIHAGATREQGDVARAQSARFYNLSWRYLTQAAVDHRGKARDLDGTLYFSGDGNVFDQIPVARGLLAGSGAARAGGKRAHRSLSGDGGPSSRRRADPLRPAQGRRRAQRECGWLQRPLPGIRAHRRSGLSRRRSELGRRRDHGHGLCAPAPRENNNRCIRGKEFNFPTSNYDIFQRITTHHPATAPASWPGPDHNKSSCPTLRDKQGGRHRRGTSCVRVSSWPRHCACRPFTSAQAAPAAQGKNPLSLAYNIKPWTGDLDGMKKRQQVRVLVPYNKTLYFLDKGGTQRGLIVDMMTEFEKRLNAGVKAHYARIHVVFLPTPRDRLIPDLLAGKGDLVAANLTITDERRAQVDFSHPLASGVRELIVTSAGAPPLASLDDLAGREVLVNPTSSYYSSLKTLSAALQARGKRPIVIRDAPGVFETDDILEMVNADLVKITVADRYLANFWKQIFPASSCARPYRGRRQ